MGEAGAFQSEYFFSQLKCEARSQVENRGGTAKGRVEESSWKEGQILLTGNCRSEIEATGQL